MSISSKFVKIILQKLISIPKIASDSSIIENDSDTIKEKDLEKEREIINSKTYSTKYIGISDSDMSLRVKHTICNLMELDEEELVYIENMNCKDMFEIVKLLNQAVSTLVENMMAIDR